MATGYTDINSRPASLPPFTFQEKTGYINWEQISKVDVESLKKNGDLSLIQNYAQGLVYSDLRKTDLDKINNPNFVKLFKLSQLSIEYLLYVQDFLENVAKSTDAEYEQLRKECSESEQTAKEQRERIVKLKKDIHNKKRAISTYDFLIKEGAQRHDDPMFACRICKDKFYVSRKALQGHYKRRHPDVEFDDLSVGEIDYSRDDLSDTMKENQRIQKNTKRNASQTPKNPPKEIAIEETVKDAVQKEMLKVQELLKGFDQKLINMTIVQPKQESVSAPILAQTTPAKPPGTPAFNEEISTAEKEKRERERVLLEKQAKELEEKNKEIEKLKAEMIKEHTELKKKPELKSETMNPITFGLERPPTVREAERLKTPDRSRQIGTIDIVSIAKVQPEISQKEEKKNLPDQILSKPATVEIKKESILKEAAVGESFERPIASPVKSAVRPAIVGEVFYSNV